MEVGSVVCDKRKIVNKGDRGNHQVGRWHRNALLKEAAPNFAKLLGAGEVEVQDLHVRQ